MTSDFDIGPLTWVKEEIDKSLDMVSTQIHVLTVNPHDHSPVKLAKTHLYQAAGALDMVGLQGCQFFCTTLEQCFTHIETTETTPEDAFIDKLLLAVDALKQYVEDLMHGASDEPLRLYQPLLPIAQYVGVELEKPALFFPDTSVSIPKSLATFEISDAEYTDYISKHRQNYQRAFLAWLQTQAPANLLQMAEALRNVCYAQTKSAIKSLWWVISGFVESLQDPEISSQHSAKKLCRRLDQELKLNLEGQSRANPQLLKEALFYIATSSTQSESLALIRETFKLKPSMDVIHSKQVVVDVQQENALTELLALADRIEELWSSVSSDVQLDAVAHANAIEINSVLVTQCLDLMEAQAPQLAEVSMALLPALYQALMRVLHSILNKSCVTNYPILIEITTGFHLFSDGIKHLGTLSQSQMLKMQSEIEVLNQISTGAEYARLQVDRSDELEPDTLKAVVTHVLESLKKAEQSLDAFFRSPQSHEPLNVAMPPIQSVAAVFHMMNMETPADIARLSIQFIEYFKTPAFKENQGEFELVAESLSMLGIYAEELPAAKHEYAQVLQETLGRLQVIYAQRPQMQVPTVAADIESVATSTKLVEDQAYDDELLDIYLTEAEEVLQHIHNHLAELNADVNNTTAMVEVRRSYHTLKGSGRTVGLKALGDIAGKVESFLNPIIDKKEALTTVVVGELATVTGAFDSWVKELRENSSLKFDPQIWLDRIGNWKSGTKTDQESAVMIDGKRAMSRQFYQIFLNESMLHITTLEQELAKGDVIKSGPSDKAKHAVHTLGSNALAAGFTAMGELSRATEEWFDLHAADWQSANQSLFGQVVHALSEMWQQVSKQQEPSPQASLVQEIKSDDIAAIAWPDFSGLSLDLSETAPLEASTSQQVQLLEATNGQPVEQKVIVDEEKLSLQSIDQMLQDIDLSSYVEKKQREEASAKLSKPVEKQDVLSDVVVALSNDAFVYTTGETVKPLLQAVPTAPVIIEKTPADLNSSEIEVNDSANDEILSLFTEEAELLLPKIGQALRHWRANPDTKEDPDNLQRDLHTLKGSARMASKQDMATLLHQMEEQIVSAIKHGIKEDTFDNLLNYYDGLGAYVESADALSLSALIAEEPVTDVYEGAVPEIIDMAISLPPIEDALTSTIEQPVSLNDLSSLTVAQSVTSTAHDAVLDKTVTKVLPNQLTQRKSNGYLRLRADLLDRLINEAGEISIIRSRVDKELIAFKHASADLTDNVGRMRQYLRELEIEAETQLQSRLTLLQETNEKFDPLEFDRFTRLQELTRMLAESVNDISTIQQHMSFNIGHAEAALQQQNRMNRDIQQAMMQVRMLPFDQLSERLHRIVRQTARDLNKRAELVIEGEKAEIDRSVLDKIGAPLEHLLRNAIAHGIELPEARKAQGKPETGQITLTVSSHNDEITIKVKDDGAGIDVNNIIKHAKQKGLIGPHAELNDQQAMALIFENGFSTSEKIDQIAGRGVGMDVVRSEVGALGGRVDTDSHLGLGTTFSIYLPVTLTVAQVLMVRASSQSFVLSVSMIDQAQKLKREQLLSAYEQGEIVWAGQHYQLHNLSKLLNIGDVDLAQSYASVILLRSGTYRLALHVDEVLGNHEVVVKPIGSQLARVPGIMGATVSGDGGVIFIINPILMANREGFAVSTEIAPVEQAPIKKQTVLVVDDSLTMRKVLGRLMEREGFEVLTAKDGIEAVQMLKETTPDIVLSDIEMPRMDGFGLVRNIRDDAKTKNTPIIMISSRTADKHQNLAKDIGVNAFFGKPVQDDELLEKVKELISTESKS